MSWNTKAISILRTLIDDTGPELIYDDEDLQSNLIVSGYIINTMVFNSTYMVDIANETISPDPSSEFIILTCLKSACIILKGKEREAASNSMRVHDGPSIIDTTKQAEYYAKMADKQCFDFEEVKTQYLLGNSIAGHIVVSGHTVDSIFPSNIFSN